MNDAINTPAPKGRILVVDDMPANLHVLIKLLSAQGYAVHAAGDGASVFLCLEHVHPDLILLDIRMPGMDGYQVCKQIKANPHTAGIPVIFISAADETLDKVRAFASGGVDYMVKPFQEEEVLARVATHLSLRRLQSNLEHLVEERTADLVKAQEKVIASQKLLQRIIDNSTALIYVKDLQGRYLLVNSRFCMLFGVSAEGIAGKTDAEALPETVTATLRTLDRQAGEAGAKQEGEQEIPVGGTLRTYLTSRFPLTDETGEDAAVCTILTDITERVRAETAIREVNEMLERRLVERQAELRHLR